MQIVLWILSIALLVTTTASNFYISWLATFAALIFTTSIMVCNIGTCFSWSEKKMEQTPPTPGGSEESSPIK